VLGGTVLTFLYPGHAARLAEQRGAPGGLAPSRPSSESTVVSFDISPPRHAPHQRPFSEAAFRELRRANERLSVFYDFSRHVGNVLDIDRLLKTVARRIMKLIPADSGVILLKSKEELEVSLHWAGGTFRDVSEATYSRTAIAKALDEKRGFLIQDISSQPDLSSAQSVRQLNIQSTMVVPIVLEREVFGVLCLSACGRRADFGADDFAMVSGIAGQMAIAIKNAHLADSIRRTTAERERLQKELEIAAHVQKSILPAAAPSVPGLDVAGISFPAREVGGDFFDYVCLGSEALGTTVADVSGKGLAAALLTLQSRNVIHAIARENPSPASVLHKANSVIYDDYSRAGMFLSAFYGVVDTSSRSLRYASAGHNPPLLLRADGTCSSLGATGSLLGVSPELPIGEESIDLGTSDLLALYTDGISEARDKAGVEFGCDKLAKKLSQYRKLPAGEIASRVLREVSSFAGPNPFDDATLVVIKIEA
jgi:serine phosphatase RsbU (regulator of sigma subunit)